MCGIAGCVVEPGRSPDRAALDRMAAALAHRGPDGSGVEIVGNVGLAHRRLAIVDPSPAGAQPMRSPEGWWLTYNGEVFNHLSLRSSLGGGWEGGSDTETLLRALVAWGEEAVPRLNGLFAFAALDPVRRRLLLVRDRLGVKPLYLAWFGGALWFASEIRALFAAGVPAQARDDVLRHAVVPGWVNGAATPFDGITRLLPGTIASVSLDDLSVSARRWWRPAELVDAERMASLARASRSAWVDAVEETLRESVRRRLMADVRVGTLCSGGIDSSLITLFAAQAQPGILSVNASLVDQPDVDEAAWASLAADAAGAELHTVRVTADAFRSGLVRTVEHHEYPLVHPGSVPMVDLAALARENGAKVLLSGEGADELFGGYAWLHQRDQALFAARRSPLALVRALLARHPSPPAAPPAVAEFEEAALADARAAYAHHRGARARLEAGLASSLETYLSHLLMRQDKCTMASSVETRVPFLDPDVVGLALNLPLEARIEPQRKGVLRDLARKLLPAGIADRPKIGFGFETRRIIEEAADPAFLLDGRLREALRTPAAEWEEGVRTMPDAWALSVWSAEVWARLFLAGESRAAVEASLWRRQTA